MAFAVLKRLFSCSGCEQSQAEVNYLRAQLSEAQSYLSAQRKEMDARMEGLTKNCMDRVMSKSYTEYALGQANEHPDMTTRPRSDEDEYLIEKNKEFQKSNELRQVEAADAY